MLVFRKIWLTYEMFDPLLQMQDLGTPWSIWNQCFHYIETSQSNCVCTISWIKRQQSIKKIPFREPENLSFYRVLYFLGTAIIHFDKFSSLFIYCENKFWFLILFYNFCFLKNSRLHRCVFRNSIYKLRFVDVWCHLMKGF